MGAARMCAECICAEIMAILVFDEEKSLSSVARELRIHQSTARKYLTVLLARGEVYRRKTDGGTLWRIPGGERPRLAVRVSATDDAGPNAGGEHHG